MDKPKGIFEVKEFRITQQVQNNEPSYKVTMITKGANPTVAGDMIVRATTGDKWFVTESYGNKLFIIPFGKHSPMDMIGSWGLREHAHIEKE